MKWKTLAEKYEVAEMIEGFRVTWGNLFPSQIIEAREKLTEYLRGKSEGYPHTVHVTLKPDGKSFQCIFDA